MKASGRAAASHINFPTASMLALPSIINEMLADDVGAPADTAARECLDVMNALVVVVVKDFVK